MPRYVRPRDLDLFKQISKEITEDVVETPVVLYKISVSETRTNLYGESAEKVYLPGVQVYAWIGHDAQATTHEGFGPDVNQTANFRFQRWRLEDKGIYPQRGDIIDWNNSYFEIGNVIENQMPGGVFGNVYSIVCESFMVRRSKLNIEERQQ